MTLPDDNPTGRTGRAAGERGKLLALLGVSWLLRVILALRGGQYFWTDETRFIVSKTAATDLVHGRLRAAADGLFASADHLLFKVIGVLPALAQLGFGDTPVLPALFFGSFSVGLIYLSWRLALSQGASAREALFTAFLVATTNLFFYYTRHLFPYDAALCLFLGAALLGFRRGSLSHFGAGLLAGLGFLAYNGYWLFGGTVLALTVLSGQRRLRDRVVQGLWSLSGLVLPILLVLGIGRLLQHDLVRSYVEFSRTVGGDRGNAWRMIPAYLWSAEHGMALFWLLAVLAATGAWVAGMAEARARTWLLGAMLFAGGMVGLSDVVQRFSVYGRHSRPLALFLCLLGGWLLERLCASGRTGRRLAVVLVLTLAVQAAVNFRAPLRQEFPPQFSARAAGVVAAAEREDARFYRTMDDGPFGSEANRLARIRPHVVLLRSPHPYQFEPYAFDGFNEAIRADFRRNDFAMEAVRLLPEAPGTRVQLGKYRGPWTPMPGPLRFRLIFDPRQPGFAEPLVSSGTPGAADQIFYQFTGPRTLRLGFDHWGNPAVLSREIACDPRLPHTLVVSVAPLCPAADGSGPDPWRDLRPWVLATLDGEPVLKLETSTYPCAPASVAVLHNLASLSSSARDFSGRVLSVSAVPPDEVIGALGFNPAAKDGPWAPFPGALRIRLYFPPAAPGLSVPLVSSGVAQSGDQVFARFPGPRSIQVGFDHWGHPALLSSILSFDPALPHTVVISYGALYPSAKDPRFLAHSPWAAFKHRVYVSLDGQPLLDAWADSYEAGAGTIAYFHNLIGFSSAQRDFTGTFLQLEPEPTDAIPLGP